MPRRRDLLIIAGVIGTVAVAPKLVGLFSPEFTFEPIPDLDGFRRLPGGTVSGTQIAMIGLDPISEQQAALQREVLASPCRAIFGASEWTGLKVPVAVFSDYNCPICPALDETVRSLIDSGAPINVIWYDFPVLGPRSEDAARAALAAGLQGKYLPVHEHLMRTVLPPGPVALRRLADQFDMDPAQFQRDAASPDTESRIDRNRAIASVFGISGTPALVVGRTLVTGNISRQKLEALIALEQQDSGAICASG